MIKVYTREMRILLMYDIYYNGDDDTKMYNKFVNHLYKLGYIRIQYSIYAKILPTHTEYENEKRKILRFIPKNSNVRILLLTEKQYQNIEILNGIKAKNEIYNLEEEYIRL
ncbi:CRISPR-associated endonuclease Cas2 [Metamycoplasma gateae]|uniref:CRISPR-associated endoribonuclease Cas2 n=1 Tax=Metamycoplasma gateae TaxID=35769 RepID=A0ABZ2AIE4_9BACT|nr:CRISPR-associated endonuclease Cas2 [Metamycoplasma gateae]